MKRLPHIVLLVIIYAAFISLGLPDSVLGVAWPSMRSGWGQPLEAIGVIALILTVCSAISSFASAFVLKRLTTGPVILISCVLTGGALLGFSIAPSFWWLVPLAFPLGFGAGSVDAGLNHFVARHYSSRHMNWLHGCWGIGATIGPVIMGSALAGAALGGEGWAAGYRTISLIQLALAVVFLFTLPLWKREGAVPKNETDEAFSRNKKGPAPQWTAWLAPFLYLIYSAVEGGTGLWAASILVEGRGVDQTTAGIFVSFFFGSIMTGRFLTGVVSRRLGNRLLVRTGLIIALCGAALFSFAASSPAANLAGLVLLGLGCAPVYPGLMHETPRRFDPDTSRVVVGRQVAFAYVGAALVPPAFGLLAAGVGLWAIMPGVAVAAALLFGLSEVLNGST